MPQNPPENTPRICPYLLYRDPGAALEWLVRVFGFAERFRIPGPDGSVVHAEVEYADGLIMIGCPAEDFKEPKDLDYHPQLVHVYVEDVDAHFARAKEAGATIVSEPEDQFYGDRSYSADDLAGHRWYFAQHIRDVPLEEIGGQMPD